MQLNSFIHFFSKHQSFGNHDGFQNNFNNDRNNNNYYSQSNNSTNITTTNIIINNWLNHFIKYLNKYFNNYLNNKHHSSPDPKPPHHDDFKEIVDEYMKIVLFILIGFSCIYFIFLLIMIFITKRKNKKNSIINFIKFIGILFSINFSFMVIFNSFYIGKNFIKLESNSINYFILEFIYLSCFYFSEFFTILCFIFITFLLIHECLINSKTILFVKIFILFIFGIYCIGSFISIITLNGIMIFNAKTDDNFNYYQNLIFYINSIINICNPIYFILIYCSCIIFYLFFKKRKYFILSTEKLFQLFLNYLFYLWLKYLIREIIYLFIFIYFIIMETKDDIPFWYHFLHRTFFFIERLIELIWIAVTLIVTGPLNSLDALDDEEEHFAVVSINDISTTKDDSIISSFESR
ncbi:hypothetical protein ABK040_000082 [Willaertia magna]